MSLQQEVIIRLNSVLEYARSVSYMGDEYGIADLTDDILVVGDEFYTLTEVESRFQSIKPKFDELLEKLPPETVVSGSACLAAVSKKNFIPNDIDLYMHSTPSDTCRLVKSVDAAVRAVYCEDYEIMLVRSPYILTWCIVTESHKVIVSYQLV